jgi:hypothetical protein
MENCLEDAAIMTIPLAKKINGKKFLWDGGSYANRDEAAQAMEAYEKDGFEVQLVTEGDQYLVYSRRVAGQQSS